MLCWWFCCAGDFVVLVISFVLVILLRWCCSLVISLCWCFRCAGDVVVLVISLYWWFLCACDFVALVMFAGAFVVLVISLRWWCCCAGDFVALVISLRWWFRCDFIALVMLLCWWWFRCAGCDVVVLVSCLSVNCCSGAFAETIWAHDACKKNRFPIAEVRTRSPGTWIHLGSWLPSCFFINLQDMCDWFVFADNVFQFHWMDRCWTRHYASHYMIYMTFFQYDCDLKPPERSPELG